MKRPRATSTDMRWFRLYHDVVNERKVQSLKPELFKFWVNLLCVASAHEPRGRLPRLDADIAFALRLPEDRAAAYLKTLVDAGLIDIESDGTRVMHAWDKRQPKSDDGAARQQAFRERHRNVTCNVTGDVTGSALEQEQEGEQEQEAALRQPQTAPPPLPTDDDLLTIREGRHTHSPADVAAFWAEIWRAFGREPLCREWYEHQRRHSLPAWKAAFSEAKRRNKPFASVAYVEKIAHDFDDAGRKKQPRGTAANGSPSAFDNDPDAETKRDREAIFRRYGAKTDA